MYLIVARMMECILTYYVWGGEFNNQIFNIVIAVRWPLSVSSFLLFGIFVDVFFMFRIEVIPRKYGKFVNFLHRYRSVYIVSIIAIAILVLVTFNILINYNIYIFVILGVL